MDSVRHINFDGSDIEREDGYCGKVMYSGESCILIATKVPAGVQGPDTHTHTSDQIYYVIDGEITIQLGTEVLTAPRNSVIFIPAGVPHHNWNAGNAEEVHLEVIAPGGMSLRRPLTEKTESTDAKGLPYFVLAADESKFSGTGMTTDRLVTRERGSDHVYVYLADVPAGASGPALHIHEFDQFFVVLEGALHVEMGLKEYVLGPRQLTVMPAGVPHRQWNEGPGTERHIAILAPTPDQLSSPTNPWDTVVSLARAEKS